MAHTCGYLVSRPDLFPPEHRSERCTADNHLAIRWPIDETLHVFVGGERQVECDEALAGEVG